MQVIRELDVKYRASEKEFVRFLSRNAHFQQSEQDENAFEKFGELYSSALIESDEEKRNLISQVDEIKHQVKQCKRSIESLAQFDQVPPKYVLQNTEILD